MNNTKRLYAMMVTLIGLTISAAGSPYNLHEYNFDDNTAQGWTVGGDFTSTNTSSGYLEGQFGAVSEPYSPAYGDFTGPAALLTDWTSGGLYTPNLMSFDFFASATTPNNLFLAFGDDNFLVYRSLNLVSGLNSFSFDFSSGWLGDTGNFNDIFSGVTFFSMTIDRSSALAETYRLDNFLVQGIDAGPGPGPGPSAIPEPTSVSLLLASVASLLALRRRVLTT
jgi:hypothetical protein